MDKLKMRLFSDCDFYFQRYWNSTCKYSKNKYFLKWKALYELIEAADLMKEYYELQNILDSYSKK